MADKNNIGNMVRMFPAEQFRMRLLQVYNWGTFDKLKRIPIARKGQLLVGASGAGKSTLLDAMTALLIPPRIVDFNAAARDPGSDKRDRNLVSYIRGAWGEQTNRQSGEFGTQYMRDKDTFSSLALTFENDVGRAITLIQLFWIRGSSKAVADVRRHYMIVERAVDLRELEIFPKSDFSIKKLKEVFPGNSIHFDEYSKYSERFRHLFGIESDMALKLLHKAQSAKNLGDLNEFLRDFMLDKPQTFAVADSLVQEFSELNSAYEAIIKARDQIAALLPARENLDRRDSLTLQKGKLEEVRLYADTYRERLRKSMLTKAVAEKEIAVASLETELRVREDARSRVQHVLNDLQTRHLDSGGNRTVQLQANLESLIQQREDMSRKRRNAEGAFKVLNWGMATTADGFAFRQSMARAGINEYHEKGQAGRDARVVLAADKRVLDQQFAEIREEIHALQRNPSNIPAFMLALRRRICQAVNLKDDELPFAGELMEIKAEEAKWTGAIERVLHGFAMSLLVDECDYSRVNAYINANDLKGKVVYHYITKANPQGMRALGADSLIKKINIKPCKWADWLRSELIARFDYVCVDSQVDLHGMDRGVTVEGLVKHNRTRHEKDDRRNINDRRNWVLGFNNQAKLALFEEQARLLSGKISDITTRINELKDAETDKIAELRAYQTLCDLQWSDIDLTNVLDRIGQVTKDIEAINKRDPVMKNLSESIEAERKKLKDIDAEIAGVNTRLLAEKIYLNDRKIELKELESNPVLEKFSPTPFQEEELARRYASLAGEVTLKNLDRAAAAVGTALMSELSKIQEDMLLCQGEIEKAFTKFIGKWRLEAANMNATLASAPDFMTMLERLMTDNLPIYESRFFAMLNEQGHQKLASLSTHLTEARREIHDKLDMVNESLSQSEFNRGTTLQIEAMDRKLKDVVDFLAEVKLAMTNSLSDDRRAAEERFIVLKRIVARLSAKDRDSERWRELGLDVRQHIEFIGREKDAQGNEVEIYRGGGGKSGGQKQKLAATVLAAALRYQLGGNDAHPPFYAPVVLDEAFDKADHVYTAQAMTIFVNFGFQMIVATPLKAVMALEPFVGGAAFVTIRDRKFSEVTNIPYEESTGRLQLPVGAEMAVEAA